MKAAPFRPTENELVCAKIARLRRGAVPRVLDLFSGCGGLSLGLKRAGFAILAGVDSDLRAAVPFSLWQGGCQGKTGHLRGARRLHLSSPLRKCHQPFASKYGFGRLIDLARAEPVAVAKHGRPVVVVMAVEEYERLKVFEIGHVDSRPNTTKKAK